MPEAIHTSTEVGKTCAKNEFTNQYCKIHVSVPQQCVQVASFHCNAAQTIKNSHRADLTTHNRHYSDQKFTMNIRPALHTHNNCKMFPSGFWVNNSTMWNDKIRRQKGKD